MIEADGHGFKATGSVVAFPGWTAAYSAVWTDIKELPALEEGDALAAKSLTPNQRFTKPPARYSEATLIKALEAKGIGRPSTYATIVDTLKKRKYVAIEKRLFAPDRTRTNRLEPARDRPSRPVQRRVHGADGGGAGQDRVRRGRLGRRGRGTSTGRSRRASTRSRAGSPTSSSRSSRRPRSAARSAVPRWSRSGDRNGRFLACSAYPKCKFTTPRRGRGRRGIRRQVRGVRRADGRQARTLRPVPRLLELPRVQEHDAASDRRLVPTGELRRASSSSAARREGGRSTAAARTRSASYAIWDKPVPVHVPVVPGGVHGREGHEERRQGTRLSRVR